MRNSEQPDSEHERRGIVVLLESAVGHFAYKLVGQLTSTVLKLVEHTQPSIFVVLCPSS